MNRFRNGTDQNDDCIESYTDYGHLVQDRRLSLISSNDIVFKQWVYEYRG